MYNTIPIITPRCGPRMQTLSVRHVTVIKSDDEILFSQSISADDQRLPFSLRHSWPKY